MIITKIKQINKTNRYHVYLDDKWSGIFLDEILVKENFKTGKEIDEDEFKEIKKENDTKVAFDMAVGYLEKYVVSEKGLKDYLKKKGFLNETITQTLEKLNEYGFLDDEKFAKDYFESQTSKKGKNAIVKSLKQKGVKGEIVENLISTIDEESELENAISLAEKFAKNRQKDPKLYQKCFAHLIYKGYDYSVAEKAVRTTLKGENNDWI